MSRRPDWAAGNCHDPGSISGHIGFSRKRIVPYGFFGGFNFLIMAADEAKRSNTGCGPFRASFWAGLDWALSAGALTANARYSISKPGLRICRGKAPSRGQPGRSGQNRSQRPGIYPGLNSIISRPTVWGGGPCRKGPPSLFPRYLASMTFA